MKVISEKCSDWHKLSIGRQQTQTEKADSVGYSRKSSLSSRVYATVFWPVGYYRPFLRVSVSTFAFEARDFSALTRYRTPFATGAFGVFLVDVP